MNQSPLLFVDRPLQERTAQLEEDYAKIDKEKLIYATECIRKKLGGSRTQTVIALIQKGQFRQAITLILTYYDKTYRYNLCKKKLPTSTIQGQEMSDQEWAERLLHASHTLNTKSTL